MAETESNPTPAPEKSEEDVRREKEEKRLRMRGRAVQELLDTETSYIRDLAALKTVYLDALRGMAGKKEEILKEEEIRGIFSNCEILLQVNSNLLEDLTPAVKAEPEEQTIGKVFRAFHPYLNMYKSYCDNFDTARDLSSQLESSNKKYRKFLEEAVKHPDARGLSLLSFLIMPVQRIPRYNMLIGEIIKYTDESHNDYSDLKAALEDVMSVSTHVNERIRLKENQNRLIELRNILKWDEELVDPTRYFVRRGPLMKISRKGNIMYEFFLFNDILLYADKKGENQFNVHRTVDLVYADLVDVPDGDGVEHSFGFDVSAPGGAQRSGAPQRVGAKSFRVIASSAQEKEMWLADLTKVFDILKQSLKKAGEDAEKVAHWVPDKDVTNCHGCGDSFSALKRKHHCRQCGLIFCAKCSSYKMFVKGLGEMERVCFRCYLRPVGSLQINQEETTRLTADNRDVDKLVDQIQRLKIEGPGARFYVEGYLKKEGGRHKSWKLRFFVLDQCRLSYYEDKEAKEANAEACGQLDLTGCRIDFIDSNNKNLRISHPTKEKLVGNHSDLRMTSDAPEHLRIWKQAMTLAAALQTATLQ